MKQKLPTAPNQDAKQFVYIEIISFLENHQIVEKIQDFGNTTGITVREESQTQDLLRLLIENDVKIRKFNANDISLHEVFVRLAGDHNAEVINV